MHPREIKEYFPFPRPTPPFTQDDPSSFRFTFCKWATVIDCPVSGRQVRELYNKSNKATLSPSGCERREAFREKLNHPALFTSFPLGIALLSIIFIYRFELFLSVSLKNTLSYPLFHATNHGSLVFGFGFHFARSVHRNVIIEITINGGDALFRR